MWGFPKRRLGVKGGGHGGGKEGGMHGGIVAGTSGVLKISPLFILFEANAWGTGRQFVEREGGGRRTVDEKWGTGEGQGTRGKGVEAGGR